MSVQHLHRFSAFCTIVVLRFLLAVHAISSEVVDAYYRTVILILSVIHIHMFFRSDCLEWQALTRNLSSKRQRTEISRHIYYFKIQFRMVHSGTSSLHIFAMHLLFISRICCVAGERVSKFIRSHPQTVKAYIDAGNDVNARDDTVGFAVFDTTAGVGMNVGS